jgi:cytochrome c oxidase accessory protein FixG
LDASPWTGEKLLKRGLIQMIFGGFSLLLAHVFMSYFVTLPQLYNMMGRSPLENLGIFLIVFLMSAALWFNFAWFREQFCIVLCPYGRLQSALIDDDSIVIGYDEKRGEPRGKKGTEGAGDCIDCFRCVQVCPTGIDIRQGLQIECIACSNCIDACDEVMTRIGRPTGLVRYDSLNGLAGRRRRIVRPRMILYTVLLLLGAAAMSVGLSTIRPATAVVTRMVGSPYFVTGDTIRNQYLLRLLNKRNEPMMIRVELVSPPPGATLSAGEEELPLGPLSEDLHSLVVTLPKSGFTGPTDLKIRITSTDGRFRSEKKLSFLGPMM